MASHICMDRSVSSRVRKFCRADGLIFKLVIFIHFVSSREFFEIFCLSFAGMMLQCQNF